VRHRTEQLRADAEQDPSAQTHPFGNPFAPREWLEQRQPCVFELRQLLARNATFQELPRNRAKARLRRRCGALIQFLQSFAPPGEPDCAKRGFTRARNDVRECEVEVPERGKSRADARRQRFERRQPVVVEPALSDR
jgi:hypothetical protein